MGSLIVSRTSASTTCESIPCHSISSIKEIVMARRPSKLDRLHIPAPCPAGWENMTGDDQIRFCRQCNKQVYNLFLLAR